MSQPAPVKKNNHCWLILISCCVASLCGIGLVSNTYGVFLPFIVADTGNATSSVSVIMTISAWSTVAFYWIGAKVMSKYNTKIVTTIAGLIIAGALFLYSSCTELWQFYLTAVLMGSSLAFAALNIIPLLINNWFIKHRNLMMGISYIFTSVAGAIFNPFFASLCVSNGWRFTYRIAALIALLYPIVAILFIRKNPAEIGLKPYGIEESEEMKDLKDQIEIKEFPGIPAKYAFRSAPFYLMLVFVITNSFCTGFNQHWVNLGITSGFDPVVAATLSTVAMVGSSVFKIVAGRVNDTAGIKVSCVLFSLLALISMVILIIFGSTVYGVVALCCVLFGAGIAMTQLMPPQLVREVYGMRSYSTLYPIMFMAMSVGTGFTYTLHGIFITAAGSYMGSYIFNLISYAVSIIAVAAAFKLAKGTRKKYWREVGEAL